VGIDIEQVHPRLHKVAHKFMNPREGGAEVEKLSTDHLCLHWCAKEALYKLYGRRNLDFREHIQVLQPPVGHQGDFRGRIRTGLNENHYLLHAEKIDDYFMVFAVDNPEV
jgi:phosphopantetheinyl transferase